MTNIEAYANAADWGSEDALLQPLSDPKAGAPVLCLVFTAMIVSAAVYANAYGYVDADEDGVQAGSVEPSGLSAGDLLNVRETHFAA